MLESVVLWCCRSSQWTSFISDMTSFKPTKVQFLPKLGEQVTEDSLYWRNYKVWELLKERVYRCFDCSGSSVFVDTHSLFCVSVSCANERVRCCNKDRLLSSPASQLRCHSLHQSEPVSFSFKLIFIYSCSLLFKVKYSAFFWMVVSVLCIGILFSICYTAFNYADFNLKLWIQSIELKNVVLMYKVIIIMLMLYV